MDSAFQTFIAEAFELLVSMENALTALDSREDSAETLNELFRAAHTIKGSSGLFGLDDIVYFTHVVEDVIDRLRNEEISLDKPLLRVLFRCRDHIFDLVEHESSGTPNRDILSKGSEITSILSQWRPESEGTTSDHKNEPQDATNSIDWRIRFKPGPDSYKNGMDPLSIIRFLRQAGDIEDLRVEFKEPDSAPSNRRPLTCVSAFG